MRLQWRGVEPVAIAIIKGMSRRTALVFGRMSLQPIDDERQR
jgi:hypothetical protein